MKTCNKCNQNKSYNAFSKHPTISDGYYNQCKQCRHEARKKREAAKFSPDFTGSKVCKRCLVDKSKDNFLINKSTSDGFNGWCKSCTKDASILAKYAISLNEYNRLLDKQNNSCAICGTKSPAGVSGEFVIDHCHDSGTVRGLLCNHCNTGLGKLGDTIESLEKALKYLKLNSDKIESGE